MYSYYLLAALGPQVQPYLWWKKYLTAFQMIQFIAIMIHAFQLLFIECNYPKAFVWWIGLHAVMFLFLFNEFYKQSYIDKKAHKQAKEAKIANTNGTAGNHMENGMSNGEKHTISNGSSQVNRRDTTSYHTKDKSTVENDMNLRKPYKIVE